MPETGLIKPDLTRRFSKCSRLLMDKQKYGALLPSFEELHRQLQA